MASGGLEQGGAEALRGQALGVGGGATGGPHSKLHEVIYSCRTICSPPLVLASFCKGYSSVCGSFLLYVLGQVS